MRPETVAFLLDLNRRFYAEFAEAFAQTRAAPQPGFARLLPYLPQPCLDVLDVGCGNGRWGAFLSSSVPDMHYVGVDFTADLLTAAAANFPGYYVQRDLTEAGALADLGRFDLCVCLAVMQHIPGRKNRLLLLQGIAACLHPHGRAFFSNWQFMDSARQRRKVVGWREVELDPAHVEPGDYLLTWQRDGRGLRYVHQIDSAEMVWLAEKAGLRVLTQFRSDGREGNLNLYTVLGF